ncbi:unnamed protein product (macronuclear) [Paramecium tetraurelia]|uniref:Uncharacterized protein n=1 Tax=Paramecium tetraurelia TaxID=5888 RepID=A0DIJ1_PARTE|nr:uncharacterized protein GSPATT00039522001 [Paramecium tetraurelia]CAK82858.1 unnamed protein product [Paramecium tetraurelia]|eukprot:XP_001450255.1 hypothetical protein (macronuclear) [Paramecium tetraurelia strain d4-2]
MGYGSKSSQPLWSEYGQFPTPYGRNTNTLSFYEMLKQDYSNLTSDNCYKDILAEFQPSLIINNVLPEDGMRSYVTIQRVSQNPILKSQGALIFKGEFVDYKGYDLRLLLQIQRQFNFRECTTIETKFIIIQKPLKDAIQYQFNFYQFVVNCRNSSQTFVIIILSYYEQKINLYHSQQQIFSHSKILLKESIYNYLLFHLQLDFNKIKFQNQCLTIHIIFQIQSLMLCVLRSSVAK